MTFPLFVSFVIFRGKNGSFLRAVDHASFDCIRGYQMPLLRSSDRSTGYSNKANEGLEPKFATCLVC